MKSHIVGQRFLVTALGLMAALSGATIGARAVSAQQSANIYAVANLTPPGSSTEGSASSATFERTGNGSTQVTVVLAASDALPPASYKVEIRDGSCTGALLYALQSVQTNDKGEASAVSQVKAEVEFGRWYVAVYPGDASASAPALCGQVNPALAGAPVSVVSGGGSTPGMPQTGQVVDNNLLWFGLPAIALMLLLGLVFYRVSQRSGQRL